MSTINVGDQVKFISSNRGEVIGTVTGEKWSKRGSRNPLVKLHRLHIPAVRLLLVLPGVGAGVWKVPESMCTKIGRAADVQAAVQKADRTIAEIKGQDRERRSANFKQAFDAGVADLKPGDAIQIKFKTGWRDMQFARMSSSGRVGFTDLFGRVRFCHPRFVRKPQ
jgi:hypothetical protein